MTQAILVIVSLIIVLKKWIMKSWQKENALEELNNPLNNTIMTTIIPDTKSLLFTTTIFCVKKITLWSIL